MALYSMHLLIIIMFCGLSLGEELKTNFGNENKEFQCGHVKLNFSNLGLRKIVDGFISSENVEYLDLESNEIEEGSFQAFEKLPNLEYLNLAGNRLNLHTFLESGIHENLHILILDRMEFPPSEFYNHDENLKMDIYFNNLVINTNLPKLIHLALQDLNLGYLQSMNWTQTLPSLTHLYFSGNNLKHTLKIFLSSIPSSIRSLYIERSEIYSIPITDKNYFLTTLSLNGNKINCLESSLEDCNYVSLSAFENLKFLSISNNEIFYISPNAFDKNAKLVSLNLSKNNISYLDVRIYKNLHNLEILNLTENRLEKVLDICKLKKLRNLYLDRNLIKVLDSKSFCSSDTLEILSLSGNGIEAIPSDAFIKLKNVIELNLSENELAHFDCQMLTNLHNLLLTGNQIQSMEHILLRNVTLDLLDIRNNPINEINTFSTKYLTEKGMINVHVKRFKF